MAIVNVLNEPNQQSSDVIWIQWHKDLKSVLGKKTADSVFLQFWTKRGTDAANTHALREYAGSQGFQIDGGVIGGVLDTVYDVADNIADVFKIGKYVSIAVIVIIVGSIGLLLFNIASKPIETIKAAK
jgi:hypothetical protein